MRIDKIRKEQAIEIAKLIFLPFVDYITSDFDFSYVPHDKVYDEGDYAMIKFNAKVLNKDQTYMVHIYPSLDCTIGTYEFKKFDGREDGVWYGNPPLPTRNQYRIQKKFIEWQIEPEYKS